MTISVACGAASSVPSSTITLEVYSCADKVTFPALTDIKFQLGAVINPLASATAETTDSDLCPILPNMHTSTALPAGLSMTADGVFSTGGGSIIATSVTVTVRVGSESFSSIPFTIEVFDCASSISWPGLSSQKLQVGSDYPYATAAA